MTTAAKKATRFLRWLRSVREKNKPPHKWYEHSYYDA
jgi:hypothetical protein